MSLVVATISGVAVPFNMARIIGNMDGFVLDLGVQKISHAL